ncbi:N-acetylglucosamine kinase [Streptosporangium sp. NPDC000396]|uniref:N-acetylglucosamine kinase n=1 Tax=Streptosporangium sp. NPDC000396 TaxID=3366185 RepID=UPI0036743B9E
MSLVLGVDAGGTSSRVVIASPTGSRVAHGRAGGGNPAAQGVREACANIGGAVRSALAGVDPSQVRAAVVGMAGCGVLRDPAARAIFDAAWSETGLVVEPQVIGDVAVAFAAGTAEPHGTVLIAGTGAIAAKIIANRQADLADGYGWQLGDEGSAFWIGRAAAKLTIRTLATTGTPHDPHTATTPATAPPHEVTAPTPAPASPHRMITPTGTPPHRTTAPAPTGFAPAACGASEADAEDARHGGAAGLLVRSVVEHLLGLPGVPVPGREPVDLLATAVQARPPLALAELAPLVSRAAERGDPAALSIVAEAARRLAATAAEVRVPGDHSPIVLAGSVLTSEGPVRHAVRDLLEQRWGVPVVVAGDGAGAAAWLAASQIVTPGEAGVSHAAFTALRHRP